MKKYKLYVWHGVLTDYTSGVIFAVASNLSEARKVLLKKCDNEYTRKDIAYETQNTPEVLEIPSGGWVYGGG